MLQKRFFGMMVLLVAFMLVFAFVSCGSSGDPSSPSGGDEDPTKVAKPAANPAAGAVSSGQEITLTSSTSGAGIRYTTDGVTNPTSTTGTEYSAANRPKITEATTIKAIAYKDGMTDSDILTAAYTISGGTGPTEITWSEVSDAGFGTSKIFDIAYGNNTFVAVGMDKKIATSTNGSTWSLKTVTGLSGFHNWIYHIAYGNGKFVIFDYEGRAAYASEDDLTSWTTDNTEQFGGSQIQGIAYGNNKFFVWRTGQIKYSSDGGASWDDAAWTGGSPFSDGNSKINSIAWNGSKYVAAGYDYDMLGSSCMIATSTDGITWTEVTTHPFTNNIGTIRLGWDGNKFVVLLTQGLQGRVAHSNNGENWSSYDNLSYDNPVNLNCDLVFGGGKYAIGGIEGSIYYSDDAKAWEKKTISDFSSTYIIKLVYGAKKLLALAFDGGLAYTNAFGTDQQLMITLKLT